MGVTPCWRVDASGLAGDQTIAVPAPISEVFEEKKPMMVLLLIKPYRLLGMPLWMSHNKHLRVG